jgi:hypothetical protein
MIISMYKKTILFWLMMVFFLFGQAFCEEIFDLRVINADMEILPKNNSCQLGSVVAAGDINGDGIDDIVITDICNEAVYIIYGNATLSGIFDLEADSADVRIDGIYTYQMTYSKPLATFGDINGDGIQDLIIYTLSGKMNATYVIYGNVSLPPVIDIETYPDLLRVEFSYGGATAVGSGDFNGDGFDDLMIASAFGGTPRGVEVLVKFGAENLPGQIDFSSTLPDMHIRVTNSAGPNPSVCPSDINNDGWDDIIFSDIKYYGSCYPQYCPTIWTIYGDTILQTWINLDSTSADLSIYVQDWAYFGAGIGAGDVNGDGFNDLVIGEPLAGFGKTYFLYGDTLLPPVFDLEDTTADVSIYGLDSTILGNAIATGDFNGDGHMDMLSGRGHLLGYHLSKAVLVFGGENLPGEIFLQSGFDGITIIGEQDYDLLGCALAMGDFNGDGFDDLLLAAPGKSPLTGKVFVIFGDSVIHHGDPNYDKVTDIGDVVYLLNYLFRSGPVPYPKLAGDATCDGIVDVGDIILLINYLFKAGTVPSC